MSRARNIKPGFFKNDLLAECDPLARILFAGLWCEADREGRLEDRPKRLKAEYLAYDECDADELLAQLSTRGFIIRYVVDGKRYIAILAFCSHQNPHVKEAASTIPAPDKNSAGTVLATSEPGTDPADSPSLITDSMGSSNPRRASALELPDWLAPEAWKDWHDFRNARKGWTPKAKALSLSTLTKLRDAGHEPRAVIDQSIERGWTGLFPIKPADGAALRRDQLPPIGGQSRRSKDEALRNPLTPAQERRVDIDNRLRLGLITPDEHAAEIAASRDAA